MVIWFSNISDNRGVASVGPGNIQNNMNYKWNPKVQMYTHIWIWFKAWDSSFKGKKKERITTQQKYSWTSWWHKHFYFRYNFTYWTTSINVRIIRIIFIYEDYFIVIFNKSNIMLKSNTVPVPRLQFCTRVEQSFRNGTR